MRDREMDWNSCINLCKSLAYHKAHIIITYLLLIFCNTSAYGSNSISNNIEYIKIGGLFAPISSYTTLELSNTQIQMQAGFLMAINEINNKTDSIADNILPHTKILFDVGWGENYGIALTNANSFLLDNSNNNIAITSVINGLSNNIVIATQNLLGLNVPPVLEIDTFATTSELSEGNQYQYKAMLNPVQSYDAHVIASILKNYYSYSKIGLIISSDEEGMKAYQELLDTYSSIEILDLQIISSDLQTISSTWSGFSNLQSSGATIFLLFLSASLGASVMEKGYNYGLFHEGTQIFMSSLCSTDITSYFTNQAIVSNIMRGVISVNYWPEYNLLCTTTGKEFIQRWRQQRNTVEISSSSSLENNYNTVCDQAKDSRNVTYLYQYLYSDQSNKSICLGLNFQHFYSNGTDISRYAILAYDAVYSVAMAYDYLIYNNISITGQSVRNTLLSKVNYTGVSGIIGFNQSNPEISYYKRGDRNQGLIYQIVNYHSIEQSFTQVGYWNSSSDQFTLCFQNSNDDNLLSDSSCSAIEYNTIDNQPPSDTQADVIEYMPTEGKVLLLLMFGLLVIMVFSFAYITGNHRKHKLIRAAQPEMLAIILFGILLIAFRVFVDSFNVSTATCSSGQWLAHMGFTLAFGGLYIKTYRIHAILNHRTLQRRKFDTKTVLFYTMISIFSALVLLSILQAIGRPHLEFYSTTNNNTTTKQTKCGYDYPQVLITILVIEACIITMGAKLCYDVKDVPDAVNESKHIVSAILFISMIAGIILPITSLLTIKEYIKQIITSMGLGVAAALTLFVIFAPKFIQIYLEEHKHDGIIVSSSYTNKGGNNNTNKINPISNSNNNSNTNTNNIFPNAAYSMSISTTPSIHQKSKQVVSQASGKTVGINITGLKVYYDSTEVAKPVMKKLTYDDRATFCVDQISKWQGLLSAIRNRENIESSVNSSSYEPGDSGFDATASLRLRINSTMQRINSVKSLHAGNNNCNNNGGNSSMIIGPMLNGGQDTSRSHSRSQSRSSLNTDTTHNHQRSSSMLKNTMSFNQLSQMNQPIFSRAQSHRRNSIFGSMNNGSSSALETMTEGNGNGENNGTSFLSDLNDPNHSVPTARRQLRVDSMNSVTSDVYNNSLS